MSGHPRTRWARAILFLAVAQAIAPGDALAANWTGAADPSPPNGVYNNPSNWSGNFGLVPGAADLGIFDLNATYTVTFTGNQALGHASVRAGSVSWLSDSATVRSFALGTLSAGGPSQTLTIGSATKPLVVTSSNPIEGGTVITVGSGTIVVDGASSVLNGPSVLMGSFADLDGTLRYQNGAQGAIGGAIDLGNSNNNDSNGLLETLSGADLTGGNINLATTTSTATGTINVTGAGSTLVQSGAVTLTVGGASGGAGTINVNTGGAFTTGSGLTTVNATGTINRTGTGVFNVTGNLTLNGGQFITPGGSFSRGAGQSLTVQSGGLFDLTPPAAGTDQNGTAGGTLTNFGTTAIASGTIRLEGGVGGTGSSLQVGRPGGAGGALNQGGGSLSLSGTAQLSLNGGRGGVNGGLAAASGTGGAGGQATLTGGTLGLSDTAVFSLQGGQGGERALSAQVAERGGNGGAGGALNAAGSTIVINTGTSILLQGGLGGANPGLGSGGHGGAGGTLNLTAGSVSVEGGTLQLAGGNGRSADVDSGGNGGVGGTLAVSAGSFTINGGGVSLAGGAGGGGGTPGTAGAAGQLNVTGGTFTMNGGEVFTGSFARSGGGVFNFNNGKLTVAGGTFNPGATSYAVDGPSAAELPTLVLQSGASASGFTTAFNVGDTNRGRLEIRSGADLTSGGGLTRLGGKSTADGQVLVDGAGSTWTISPATDLEVGSQGSGALTVSNGGAVTVSDQLSVGATSTGDGTIDVTTGGSLTSTSHLNIASGNGSTGALSVSGAGSVVNANASLNVGGTNSAAGGTGQLNVASSAAVNVTNELRVWAGGAVNHDGGSISADSLINRGSFFWNGGTLAANDVQLTDAGLLKLAAGGDKTLKTATLTIANTAKLDLTDHKLVVSTTPIGSWNGTAYTGVTGMIDTGRGNNANAQWDGALGIVTTDTRAVNNNDLCSIGVATASQAKNIAATETATFGGETILGSNTLVMFTWAGDATLDGKINIDDYGRIDGNVGQSGSVFGWFNGDFNYDGKINIDDYGIIDGNINQQTGAFPAGSPVSAGPAAVPEPASLSIICIFGAALVRRRRRAVS